VRLVGAALDLFAEQGYDATTVTQIAERAGLTRSTFHRYFPDKRDLLAAGQETLSRLLAEGVAEAPADVTPLDAVDAGLQRAAGAMTPATRAMAPRVRAAIAASAELQERDALKGAGMAQALSGALRARGVEEAIADVAGELGVLAFKRGYARWVSSGDDNLAGHARAALLELAAAGAELTSRQAAPSASAARRSSKPRTST
jgi:AcrR family transcriptional regulator